MPSRRYDAVVAAVSSKKACPPGKHEADLYDLLLKKSHSKEIERAHGIFTREYKREVLEAFLLSNASAEEIYSILGVSIKVTEIYAYLFFDTTVFSDELERIDYAYEYTKSSFGTELKRAAIDLGKECLKVRFSKGDYSVSPTVVQNNIRSTAYMMASLVRTNHLDSALANAALRWAQVGLKAVEEDIGADELGALEQLKITLETREEATNETQSGIAASEIFH
jgi:hypothetical protein